MPDVLYDAARAFSQLLNYDYHFVLGDSKRQKSFTIVTNERDMFNHVCGLDHLTDIPVVTAKTSREKIAVFKKILNNKHNNITFSDIASSTHLYESMSSQINPQTNSQYNIYDRIVHMSKVEDILDNSDKGTIYKWDNRRGGDRCSKIKADYVLVVPSKNHIEEKHYFFLVQTEDTKLKNRTENDRTSPIKTKIISAFSDRDNLVATQVRPRTILEVSKINIKSKKIIFTKTHPAYQKEKNELLATQSAQSTLSNPSGTSKVTKISISEDNNIPTNIRIQGNGTAVLYPTIPPNGSLEGLFNQFIETLVKRLDNIVHRASTAIEKLNQAVTKAVHSITAPKSRSEARRASQSKNKGNFPKKKQVAKKAVSVAPAKRSEKQEQRSSVLGDITSVKKELEQQRREAPTKEKHISKKNNIEI